MLAIFGILVIYVHGGTCVTDERLCT